jgi:hypothetical protein
VARALTAVGISLGFYRGCKMLICVYQVIVARFNFDLSPIVCSSVIVNSCQRRTSIRYRSPYRWTPLQVPRSALHHACMPLQASGIRRYRSLHLDELRHQRKRYKRYIRDSAAQYYTARFHRAYVHVQSRALS